jgi:hypothetical protein
MRLRFGAQHGLSEVVRELLVGADRVVARPEDRDLVVGETEVAGGAMHEKRSEAVAHHGNYGVARSAGCHGPAPYLENREPFKSHAPLFRQRSSTNA